MMLHWIYRQTISWVQMTSSYTKLFVFSTVKMSIQILKVFWTFVLISHTSALSKYILMLFDFFSHEVSFRHQQSSSSVQFSLPFSWKIKTNWRISFDLLFCICFLVDCFFGFFLIYWITKFLPRENHRDFFYNFVYYLVNKCI